MNDYGDVKKMRACLICGIVKSFEGFLSEGCQNCNALNPLQGSSDRIMEGTTASWSGLVGLMQGEGSWVARWQRLERRGVPGLYAMRVVGRLSEDLMDACQSRNIRPVATER